MKPVIRPVLRDMMLTISSETSQYLFYRGEYRYDASSISRAGQSCRQEIERRIEISIRDPIWEHGMVQNLELQRIKSCYIPWF